MGRQLKIYKSSNRIITLKENILGLTRYNHLLVKYTGKQKKYLVVDSLFHAPFPKGRVSNYRFTTPTRGEGSPQEFDYSED